MQEVQKFIKKHNLKGGVVTYLLFSPQAVYRLNSSLLSNDGGNIDSEELNNRDYDINRITGHNNDSSIVKGLLSPIKYIWNKIPYEIKAGGVVGATALVAACIGISENELPIAKTKDVTLKYGEDSIVLNASESSDPDGRIVEYIWELDDIKEVSSKPVITLSYKDAEKVGKKLGRLTVRDDKNATSTTNFYIEVKPPGGMKKIFEVDEEIGDKLLDVYEIDKKSARILSDWISQDGVVSEEEKEIVDFLIKNKWMLEKYPKQIRENLRIEPGLEDDLKVFKYAMGLDRNFYKSQIVSFLEEYRDKGDKVIQWIEKNHNPKYFMGKKTFSIEDSDSDGWGNEYELLMETDPLNRDTDGDGKIDSLDKYPLSRFNHKLTINYEKLYSGGRLDFWNQPLLNKQKNLAIGCFSLRLGHVWRFDKWYMPIRIGCDDILDEIKEEHFGKGWIKWTVTQCTQRTPHGYGTTPPTEDCVGEIRNNTYMLSTGKFSEIYFDIPENITYHGPTRVFKIKNELYTLKEGQELEVNGLIFISRRTLGTGENTLTFYLDGEFIGKQKKVIRCPPQGCPMGHTYFIYDFKEKKVIVTWS